MKLRLFFLLTTVLLAYCVTAQRITEKGIIGKWAPYIFEVPEGKTYMDKDGNYTYMETPFGKMQADSSEYLKGQKFYIRLVEFKSNNKYEITGDSPEAGTFTIDYNVISLRDEKTGNVSKFTARLLEDSLTLHDDSKIEDELVYTIWFKKAKK